MAGEIIARTEAGALSFWDWLAGLVFGSKPNAPAPTPTSTAGGATSTVKPPTVTAPPAPVAIVTLPNGHLVHVPNLANTIAGLDDAGINVADTFANKAGRPGGSTVTQGELDNANANPVWMPTNNTSYTAGETLNTISTVAGKVPVVGGLVGGAVGKLNAGLTALAGLVGGGTTNVALDKAINSNAHGIVSVMPGRTTPYLSSSLGAAESDG